MTSLAVSGSDRGERSVALDAARSRLGLIAMLLAATGVAWWSTAERMAGMDAGPGTDLGALGWFTGVWAVMMAAMMLPSLAPTVAVYASFTGRRELSRPLLFTAGYLLVWGAAGVAAYGLYALGKSVFAADLAWRSDGRWLAAGVLGIAALYELTPLKAAYLARCHNPVRLVRRTWRDGRLGGFAMGIGAGVSCLGCCWALMAALFALGVMSLTWMALIAALVALEKLLPWRRLAIATTAALLLALAVAVTFAPHEVPGLVVPGGSPGAMHAMKTMG